MTDVLGWRKVFAVIAPSTNTIVQPDMEAMRPAGVTNHFRDMYVENPTALSDRDFVAGTDKIGLALSDALRTAVTCAPDYLVMGVSAISFVGGRAGGDDFIRQVEDATGLRTSVGSRSVVAALEACGGIKRVAFVSPYYPSANAQVRRYLEDSGFAVQRDIPLQCTSWRDIAQQPESRLVKVLRELDGDDVDAIIQVGTNLSMARLAASAEVWLGKPVIAINTATYWHALRMVGINDRMSGFGQRRAGLQGGGRQALPVQGLHGRQKPRYRCGREMLRQGIYTGPSTRAGRLPNRKLRHPGAVPVAPWHMRKPSHLPS